VSSLRPQPDPNRLLIAAAIGLVVFLVAGLVFGQPLPAGTRLDPRLALAQSQAAIGRTVGDYTLQDEDGRPVRLAGYRGKPLLVSFVYTGCFAVCPATTKFLGRAVAEAQRALATDAFAVVSVGFNVPFDTPEAMRDFRRRHGSNIPHWDFLAADAATVDALARDLGFAYVPTAAGFDHLTQLSILDTRGRVSQQLYGDAFELPMLVASLKALAAGAPAPARDLAALIERVRILCTVYDPRAGRYRLDYGLFIELFAGLSILGGTAWYLTANWRRQRTKRA
jgi:protein SCO1/2